MTQYFICQELSSLLGQKTLHYNVITSPWKRGSRVPWGACMLTPGEKGIIYHPRPNFQVLNIISSKNIPISYFHFHISTENFAFALDTMLMSSCIFQPF